MEAEELNPGEIYHVVANSMEDNCPFLLEGTGHRNAKEDQARGSSTSGCCHFVMDHSYVPSVAASNP